MTKELETALYHAEQLDRCIVGYDYSDNSWILIRPGDNIPNNVEPKLLCTGRNVFPMVLDSMCFVRVREGAYFFRFIVPANC